MSANSDKLLKQFENISDEIEQLKSDRSKAIGGLEATQAQLKKLSCTAETIDDVISAEEANNAKLDKAFVDGFEKLKKNYDWSSI